MAVKVVDPKTGKTKIVCGAQRRDGTICMAYPLRGRERCRIHGGSNARGSNHKWFVHGKYSKDLRRDMLQDYFTALGSGQLLTQSNEIAIYDSRISLLLRQASLGRETLEMIVTLKQVNDTLLGMTASADEEEEEEIKLDRTLLRSIGLEIEALLEELTNERRKWEEVYQVVENRRKLIESERKAIVDSQKMMTESQALVLISALVNIVRKHVLDADTRNAISAEFVQLGGYANRGELEDRSSRASPYGL